MKTTSWYLLAEGECNICDYSKWSFYGVKIGGNSETQTTVFSYTASLEPPIRKSLHGNPTCTITVNPGTPKNCMTFF